MIKRNKLGQFVKGYKWPKEWKRCLFQKGHKIWLGKKHSELTIKKLKERKSGSKNPMWGKFHSEETKNKIRKSRLGKPSGILGKKHSKKTKTRISEALKGENNPFYGKTHTVEARKKIGEAQKGSKGSNWRGGISFEPYSIEWTKALKKSIRQRDKYICQICGKEPVSCIHHVDYNKKNCNLDNLITLCRNCHIKTNFNREYWNKYFQNLCAK